MGTEAETQVQPRTTFNFRVKVDGLDAALAHAVQLPEEEIAEFSHAGGGQNFDTKHPGKKKWGDLVIEKAMPNQGADTWAAGWLKETRANDGTGSPLGSRRTVTIEHLADDGNVVIDRWTYDGCWVKKLSYSKNDSGQDAERMVETVTIAVNSRRDNRG